MPLAIIVGCNGQDGTLLCRLLERENYQILGIGRGSIRSTHELWSKLLDIRNRDQVHELVRSLRPQQIYYLAGIHQSSQDSVPDRPHFIRESYEVNVFSLVNFLEAIRRFSPETRLFYAASSHVFGRPATWVQDESTPIDPYTIYGITKACGIFTCRTFRKCHQLFAAAGVLYNHESAHRSERFVSQKIIKGALHIKNRRQNQLVLGNLNAIVDWGYAPDYVDAMRRILALDEGEHFIIATGQGHTVRDFVKIAFEELDLDWKESVREDAGVLTKESIPLIGNPQKLMTRTGWKPSVSFRQMIKLLLTQAAESHAG